MANQLNTGNDLMKLYVEDESVISALAVSPPFSPDEFNRFTGKMTSLASQGCDELNLGVKKNEHGKPKRRSQSIASKKREDGAANVLSPYKCASNGNDGFVNYHCGEENEVEEKFQPVKSDCNLCIDQRSDAEGHDNAKENENDDHGIDPTLVRVPPMDIDSDETQLATSNAWKAVCLFCAIFVIALTIIIVVLVPIKNGDESADITRVIKTSFPSQHPAMPPRNLELVLFGRIT